MRNFLPIGKKVKHKSFSVLHAAAQSNLHTHPNTPRISLWDFSFFVLISLGNVFIALV